MITRRFFYLLTFCSFWLLCPSPSLASSPDDCEATLISIPKSLASKKQTYVKALVDRFKMPDLARIPTDWPMPPPLAYGDDIFDANLLLRVQANIPGISTEVSEIFADFLAANQGDGTTYSLDRSQSTLNVTLLTDSTVFFEFYELLTRAIKSLYRASEIVGLELVDYENTQHPDILILKTQYWFEALQEKITEVLALQPGLVGPDLEARYFENDFADLLLPALGPIFLQLRESILDEDLETVGIEVNALMLVASLYAYSDAPAERKLEFASTLISAIHDLSYSDSLIKGQAMVKDSTLQPVFFHIYSGVAEAIFHLAYGEKGGAIERDDTATHEVKHISFKELWFALQSQIAEGQGETPFLEHLGYMMVELKSTYLN
jgi:hypothetical protein